jgi:hypothetical protein
MYEVGELLLDELGFSKYESAIIHVLLKHDKPLTAGEIASKCGVPLPKVYQTLSGKQPSALMKTYQSSITRHGKKRNMEYSINTKKFAVELTHQNPDKKQLVEKLLSYYSADTAKQVVLPKFIELRKPGEQSERDTMRLYKTAEREIDIISRSMGYLPNVYEGLWAAAKNGVKIRILFPHKELLESKKAIEDIEHTKRVVEQLPVDRSKNSVEIKYLTKAIERFHANRMWLHGSIVDPPNEEEVKEYTGKYKGAAVFTIDLPVDEIGIYEREVVFSRDPRFVMALRLFFELLWNYCTWVELTKSTSLPTQNYDQTRQRSSSHH